MLCVFVYRLGLDDLGLSLIFFRVLDCANQINPLSVLQLDGDCNFACTGDATESCGGTGAISIYDNIDMVAPDPPVANPGPPPDWVYVGCYR